MDGVPARNNFARECELGCPEGEEACTAQQREAAAIVRPAGAHAPRVTRLTACQYAMPSQRAPDSELSTTGSEARTRCVDSKPPESSMRSLVFQLWSTSGSVASGAFDLRSRLSHPLSYITELSHPHGLSYRVGGKDEDVETRRVEAYHAVSSEGDAVSARERLQLRQCCIYAV